MMKLRAGVRNDPVPEPRQSRDGDLGSSRHDYSEHEGISVSMQPPTQHGTGPANLGNTVTKIRREQPPQTRSQTCSLETEVAFCSLR